MRGVVECICENDSVVSVFTKPKRDKTEYDQDRRMGRDQMRKRQVEAQPSYVIERVNFSVVLMII